MKHNVFFVMMLLASYGLNAQTGLTIYSISAGKSNDYTTYLETNTGYKAGFSSITAISYTCLWTHAKLANELKFKKR